MMIEQLASCHMQTHVNRKIHFKQVQLESTSDFETNLETVKRLYHIKLTSMFFQEGKK